MDAMDIIDIQSCSFEAQGIAERLVKEHGDFAKIEKVAKRMKVAKEFIDEILWAAKWILITRPAT